MRIKEISTEQFAGIHNKKISLESGVNVIYGRNEAGKSTLVNLVSRVLFQNIKIDGRSDRDFKSSFFPCEKTGNKISGDSIDGQLVIEAEDGDYVLTKEWGEEPRLKLTVPGNNIIKKQKDIEEILNRILGYKEGVYKEMLLSPQKAEKENLKNLMDGAGKTTDGKAALSEAVSLAFAQSDGISADAIEEKIKDKIDELAGKYWDIDNKCPKNKNKRYEKSAGLVLQAKYAQEDAENSLAKLENSEADLDKFSAEFAEKEKSLRAEEAELGEFDKVLGALRLLAENNEKIKRCTDDIKRFTEISANWPKAEKELKKAKALKREKEDRLLLDKYNSAKEISAQLQKITDELSKLSAPEEKETQIVKRAERDIQKLENKLCGMNLAAKIKLLGGNSVVIKSLRTGETLDLKDDFEKNIDISEAVSIEVPGVMEMRLSPADIDAEEIGEKIAALNTEKKEILDKYGCGGLSELEELAKRFEKLTDSGRLMEKRLDMALAGEDFAELEKRAGDVCEVRERVDIEADISALCGGDPDKFIGSRENALSSYQNEFETQESLGEKINSAREQLEKAQEYVSSAENISEKYRNISDPEKHKEKLKTALDALRAETEQARDKKVSAQRDLENFGKTSQELREELEKAKHGYEEKFGLLYDWVHIHQVFLRCRKELKGNPLQGLADNFKEYLGLISADNVSSDFDEGGKADFRIYSGDNLLDFDHLSDGTKGTVYLAFRLAVLDHLFPEGGGVIVLDDPLNDMDADRVKQSCKLIRAAAQRHQVIFLTCREEYISQLGGNLVNV